mmetsp:Transcript_29526/g.49869  ORF Transcript_29526/g.49869 Transcript_29526/m.49869 type:complete len:880 (+) Transcript_29526:28-2667(+)
MDVVQHKSETEQEPADVSKEEDSDVPKLCAWCAQTEEFACSQFVHGHTWSEWFAWKQCREERALARQAAVDQAAALELDRILSGEGPSEEYKDGKLTEAAATMVQVWLPVNKADAELVQREAAHSCGANTSEEFPSPDATFQVQPPVASLEEPKEDDKVVLLPPPSVEIEVLKGSLIVHEFCAEAMSAVRMSKYTAKLDAYQKAYRAQRRLMNSKVVKKSSVVQKRLEDALRQALNRKEGQYPEERTLADVLVGLGQGKVVSLGYDFSGHVYYAMAGSKALLVCSKLLPDYSPGENPVCEDSAPFSMVSMPDPLGSLEGGVQSGERQSGVAVRDKDADLTQPMLQWQVFHNRAEIEAITGQLSQDIAPEKSLRSALEILFLRKFGSSSQNNDDDEEDEDEDAAGGARSQTSLSMLLAEHDDFQALLGGDFASLQLDGTPTPSLLPSGKTDDVNNSGLLGKRKASDDVSGVDGPTSKLRSLAGTWHAPSAPPICKAALAVGARVLCDGHDCLGNALLWDAKVLAIRPKSKPKGRSGVSVLPALEGSGPEETLYKVRFIGWGAEYDSWLPESELHAVSGLGRAKQGSLRAKAGNYSYSLGDDIEMKASTPTTPWVPQILSTLTAHAYIAAPGRHNHKESRRASGLPIVFNPSRNTQVPRFSSSRRRPGDADSEDDDDESGLETADREAATVEVVRLSVTDELSVLKAALLLVQAALPLGSMDEAEDRWGRGPVSPVPYFETMALSDSATGGGAANQGPAFLNAWRHAVMSASSPALLMECQLMLEYSVRTAWLKSTGAKLMTCLPSRSQAIRGPTLGLVATRLWSLDKAVRYDKVKKGEGILEDEDELRKEKKNKLQAKQASRRKQQQKEEHNKKRAQYRR